MLEGGTSMVENNCDLVVKNTGESGNQYDVGIVSFWFANNYGAILTAFALYHHLEDSGCSVLMIEKPSQWWSGFDASKDPLARRFAEQYINLSKAYDSETLPELNRICNSFVVGSDQMWNYHLYKTAGYYTYLDFAEDDKKKIAFSTSFGHDRFFNDDPENIAKISSLLRRFDAISTREETGAELCKSIFGVDAISNVDSVFLCKREVYDVIADDHPAPRKPSNYIFAYILDGNREIEAVLDIVSKKLGLDVILVIDGGDVIENKAIDMSLPITDVENVGEWLDYIRSADFIVTDSFHGTCFSMIYNKQFISIRNKGRGGTRFDSILGKVGLMNRMVSDADVSADAIHRLCDERIQYEIVNEQLENHIRDSKKWLSRYL